MSKFKSLLDNFVFFALPLVLIFYPTKVQSIDISDSTQMHGRLKINSGTNTNPSPSLEEKVVVALFAICASVWIVGLLLATFGKGRRCVSVVSTLTYLSVASIVAFVIFALSKTMPEETFYTILFATHFVLMISAITCVWAKYVKDPRISLPSLQVQKKLDG